MYYLVFTFLEGVAMHALAIKWCVVQNLIVKGKSIPNMNKSIKKEISCKIVGGADMLELEIRWWSCFIKSLKIWNIKAGNQIVDWFNKESDNSNVIIREVASLSLISFYTVRGKIIKNKFSWSSLDPFKE